MDYVFYGLFIPALFIGGACILRPFVLVLAIMGMASREHPDSAAELVVETMLTLVNLLEIGGVLLAILAMMFLITGDRSWLSSPCAWWKNRKAAKRPQQNTREIPELSSTLNSNAEDMA